MRNFLKCLLTCFHENGNNSEIDEEIEKVQREKPQLVVAGSFEEPDKEKLPEADITDVKENQFLKPKSNHRPSILLSMDGSQHQVILYDGKIKENKVIKKKKSNHKKKKKAKS